MYPTLGSVKVSPSRVASPENYKHQTLKVSGVTRRPELRLQYMFSVRTINVRAPLWACTPSVQIGWQNGCVEARMAYVASLDVRAKLPYSEKYLSSNSMNLALTKSNSFY